MLITLVVGHRKRSQGAMNKESGITEFVYNSELAEEIRFWCKHECVIVYRDDDKNGYSKLPAKINAENGDLILSLHCNAFNTKASGHEVLYYHTSKKSKAYAEMFNEMLNVVVRNADRGLKAIKQGDRGALVLRRTNAPCVLLEPCFIDNNEDFAKCDVEILGRSIAVKLNQLGGE